jgi:catechol 2,3-dioxygenase-like lactoylglutathione lyase family enzyme
MVKSYGLTHIALVVRDIERSFDFYRQILGMIAVYRRHKFLQMQTPGSHDAIVLEERGAEHIGESGGVIHFGFRLPDAADIDAAAEAVERAGGTILEQGEFSPGEPFLMFRDPDGYEIEIWYEPPTPVDLQS